MDVIRYAVVGCGAIATNYHLPALARIEQARFIVACDLDEQRARETAAKFGAPETASDYRAVVARDDLDLVCVFTKIDSHAEIAIDAAQAGKHVFIQKPFARSVAEGRTMVAAAREADVRLIPAFMHHYFDESLLAAELVRSGAIGEVEFMRQRNCTRNPRATVGSYGGALMDIGAHGIDLIRAVTGAEIVRVAARFDDQAGGCVISDDDLRAERDLRGADLSAFALYELSSGATVSHEVQWSQPAGPARFAAEIYGTEGTIFVRVPGMRGDLAYFSERADAPTARDPEAWIVPELRDREMGAAHHEALIGDLLTGDGSAQDAEDGLAVLCVCEAARQSAFTGCWTDVLE